MWKLFSEIVKHVKACNYLIFGQFFIDQHATFKLSKITP